MHQAGCRPKKSTLTHTIENSETPPAKQVPPQNSGTQSFRSVLQVSEAEVKHNKLYSFSEQWYGSPYKYGGCERSGVDCSCFVNLLYQQVYGKTLARTAADMFKACESLDLEKMAQGDLVFFKIGGTSISHVGVLLKGKLFIHASTSRGVIVNSLDEAYYKKYFYCAGKVKKA